jgi:hypothetical protein
MHRNLGCVDPILRVLAHMLVLEFKIEAWYAPRNLTVSVWGDVRGIFFAIKPQYNSTYTLGSEIKPKSCLGDCISRPMSQSKCLLEPPGSS